MLAILDFIVAFVWKAHRMNQQICYIFIELKWLKTFKGTENKCKMSLSFVTSISSIKNMHVQQYKVQKKLGPSSSLPFFAPPIKYATVHP